MTPRRPRPAALRGAWLAFLGSVAVFAGLVGYLMWPSGDRTAAQGPIIIYCAAGIKPAVEPIAREYEQKYGVAIRPDYGGSQALLARVSQTGPDAGGADLYLPGDESYIQAGRDKGLLAETLPLARMHPVLAVAAGNPKHITSLDDLLRADISLAQADAKVAAIGKVTHDAPHWEEIDRRTTVTKPTVTDVANAVRVGAVDAGFVWDATVRQGPGLEAVPLSQLDGLSSTISVAVLSGCRQPTAALRFARYLAARDGGLPHFEKNGFAVVEGDEWADKPQIVLYAGAMLRPAVEQTLKEFQQREGAEVVTKYNGCGILVADMRTGERPDAYFACDKSFMTQVGDLFLDAEDFSTNRLVILVRKGNPHGIKMLDDLAKPGLRVGVGHEKQCALGALTQKALEQDGSRAAVMKNVKTQLPAGDMLVNEMLVGSLDAVVAYVSNASGHAAELEAIPIDVPCALAVQPMAVGRESKHKQLTERLMAALRSAESRRRFEANGFHWKASSPPSPLGGEGSGVRGSGSGRSSPPPPAPLPLGERGGKAR
jgi:ABC-type molybdate transport system substrate-binding protein